MKPASITCGACKTKTAFDDLPRTTHFVNGDLLDAATCPTCDMVLSVNVDGGWLPPEMAGGIE